MDVRNRNAVVVTLLLGTCTATAAADELDASRKHPSALADLSPEPQIIVKLRSSEGERARVQAMRDKLASVTSRAGIRAKGVAALGARFHVLQVDVEAGGESLDALLARLNADQDVEYAEPDRRRYLHAVPDDPLYAQQWYLQGRSVAPSAIDAENAWDVTTGSAGVVIAILDTGVLYDHPDLQRAEFAGRLLPGYDFVSDVAVANDGTGRDSDPTDPGDWVTAADTQNPEFAGCTVTTSSWHGTRVAGIVGALSSNATGIAGSTWQPWLLPVRVIGKCGGFDSDILAAMFWAAGVHVDGVPDNPYSAKVLNLSLGSAGPCPRVYSDAIEEIVARGALVVVSAGNAGGPVDSPANCAGAAAVGGLRHAGTKVGYSSLGPAVALSAPAGNCVNTNGACLFSIMTTVNAGTTTPTTHTYTDQINYNVGTSFSAPIVAAIAALMASVNGNLGAAQLIERLQEGATKPFPVSSDPAVPTCHVPVGPFDIQNSECSCTTSTCGAGMANAPGALEAALRPVAAVAVAGTFLPGERITLSAFGSSAACDQNVVAYEWSPAGTYVPTGDPAVAALDVPATGSVTLRLTVTDDAGRTDDADIVVSPTAATTSAPENAGSNACPAEIPPPQPPQPVEVTVSPPTSSVTTGGTQMFAATVANATDTSVTWQVDGIAGGNATLGTISAGGVFTAPGSMPSPATVTVTAVSNQDSTRSGSASITIVAPPAPKSSGGGGGGGGAFDIPVLLVMLFVLFAARSRHIAGCRGLSLLPTESRRS